jgi:hypothetical protein
MYTGIVVNGLVEYPSREKINMYQQRLHSVEVIRQVNFIRWVRTKCTFKPCSSSDDGVRIKLNWVALEVSYLIILCCSQLRQRTDMAAERCLYHRLLFVRIEDRNERHTDGMNSERDERIAHGRRTPACLASLVISHLLQTLAWHWSHSLNPFATMTNDAV